MNLTTKRLLLRRFNETDLDFIETLGTTPLYHQTAGFAKIQNEEQGKQILHVYQKRSESYLIVEQRTQQKLGLVELSERTVDPKSDLYATRELGFLLLQSAWGKGYMTEAVTALLDDAFPRLQLREVWAGHYENNQRSANFLQKIGFQYRYEVTLPFYFFEQTVEKYYLLTASDWQRFRSE
ncbi:GNAT family N-acetyltransferase [Lapidilactobacillus wuchangensis]|uniref:GNAT family N-acetyltransferase n=1 Tax=Lapidilactobacillus wuchangensis TaxID=2486001 RepID=UPI000F771D35|nr:GNAT family N-acetyltransferase [Lapidilactobacillus wuchangensis]